MLYRRLFRHRLQRTFPGLALVTTLLVCGHALQSARAAQEAPCGHQLPASGRQELSGPQGLHLAFAPRPAPVPVGRHFALDIVVCVPPGEALPASLKVDAEMPAHRHGMNYQATVRHLGGGRFVAEGLMFHMPGAWRWTFELPGPANTAPLRLQADTRL